MNGSETRAVIYGHTRFKRLYIRLEPAGYLIWIEGFINNCSTLQLTTAALDSLTNARVALSSWVCNYDDIVASFNNNTMIVTAYDSFRKITAESSSEMPVDDFTRLLSAWREALAEAV